MAETTEEAVTQTQEQPKLGPMELALQQANAIIAKEEGQKLPQEKAEEAASASKEDENKQATKEDTQEEVKKQAVEEEDKQEPSKFRAKVKYKTEDGRDEEREIDEDELIKGFMLEKDYRRKTAQISKEREAVKLEAQKAVETKLKEYDEKLQLAEQAIWHTLVPELKSIDFNKLAAEDPARWAQEYQRVQNVNSRLAAIQAERKNLAEAAQKQQQEALQKQAREAIETLTAEVPGWSNDLYGKILKAAVDEYGFKQEEAGAITDPRAIKVLNDARQWRELKAKPIVEKRVVEKPKALIKPGVAQERPNPNVEARKQALAQFQKTGNRWDAVNAVAALLESSPDGRV